jgi:manganese oxidase
MSTRRAFVRSVFGLGAASFGASRVFGQRKEAAHRAPNQAETAHSHNWGTPVMVETPDVPSLPYTLENGVKVFHLVAEPVKRKIAPYKVMDVWGYNGTCPGPTIQVLQGDRVRIIVDNHLPESTTMHWHGFEIPVQMDGMPYISQKPIPPGGRFTYEFDLHQHGTFFYHAHGAMQEMMGMIGMFVMHPSSMLLPVP